MPRLTPRRSHFTLAIVGAFTAVGLGAARKTLTTEPPAVAVQTPAADRAVAVQEPLQDLSKGDQLLQRVLLWLERRPNVTARVRQRVFYQGQEVAGTGAYWQQGVDRQRASKWELQTQGGDGAASFVQVLVGGRYLWTDRRNSTGRVVTRLDLSRLRAALLARTQPGRQDAVEDASMAIVQVRGGLSQLIFELQKQFRFELLNSKGSDARSRFTIVGRWKQAELDERWLNLDHDALAAAWPDQLPHHVVMQVGADDLFPYSIEYHTPAGASAVGASQPESLLAEYEFYDVRFDAAIEDRRFTFDGVDDWNDVTQQAIERLLPRSQEELDLTSRIRRRELRR